MTSDQFAQISRGFVRNPLGIIGLLIVLVYGIAGLVLGVSASDLTVSQRWAFTMFLVLFPVAILGSFYALVTRHHVKLYAPQDYRDENHFFRILSSREQRELFAQDMSSLRRDRSVDREQSALDLALESERLNFLLAEDLAIRALEQELRSPLSRHVRLEAYELSLAFDAVAERSGATTLVEVKYFWDDGVSSQTIEDMVTRASKARAAIAALNRSQAVHFIAAIVTNLGATTADAESEVRDLVEAFGEPVDLRFYDLGELKQRFGIAPVD